MNLLCKQCMLLTLYLESVVIINSVISNILQYNVNLGTIFEIFTLKY